jgi:hypothetical protein
MSVFASTVDISAIQQQSAKQQSLNAHTARKATSLKTALIEAIEARKNA